MSFRKRILKELYKFYELKGPDNYVLVDTLSCFSPGNEKFLSAVNQLLMEGLIIGIDSSIEIKEGKQHRVAVAINPNKIELIQKIIRNNWYEDPKFWITTLLTIVGLIIAILQIFLK
jgi:hypothetical protein